MPGGIEICRVGLKLLNSVGFFEILSAAKHSGIILSKLSSLDRRMINISSIFYRSFTYRLSLDKLFGSKAYTMGRKGKGVLISLVLRAFFRRIRNICDAKEKKRRISRVVVFWHCLAEQWLKTRE